MPFSSPYTDEPNGRPSVIYPNHSSQVLSSVAHLLGCSILAFCFSRRLFFSNFTLARVSIMAIFLDSWFFMFASGVVVSGLGMSLDVATCQAGIYLCIFFYATSKLLIYLFLSEKVHIVWSAGRAISRFQSRPYLCCLVVLTGFVAIFVLMLIGRIGYIREDGACVIGLEKMASIPLLSYDVFINIFLTSLFVRPLIGTQLNNPKLKRLARKTLVAAIIALSTSVVNILILTLLNGHQLGWVCLASCGLDVTINAVVIFVITGNNEKPSLSSELAAPSPVEKQKGTPRHGLAMMSPSKDPRGSTTNPLHTLARIGDFAETRDMGTVPSFGFDYLPQDQVPNNNAESRSTTPEKEEEVDSSVVVTSPTTRHSRGLLSGLREKFGGSKIHDEESQVMSIQVTVMTEQTNAERAPAHQTLPVIVETPAV